MKEPLDLSSFILFLLLTYQAVKLGYLLSFPWKKILLYRSYKNVSIFVVLDLSFK